MIDPGDSKIERTSCRNSENERNTVCLKRKKIPSGLIGEIFFKKPIIDKRYSNA